MSFWNTVGKLMIAPQYLAYKGWKDHPALMAGTLAAVTAPIWAPAAASAVGGLLPGAAGLAGGGTGTTMGSSALAAQTAAGAAGTASTAGTVAKPSLGRQMASSMIQQAFEQPQPGQPPQLGLPPRQPRQRGGTGAYPAWQQQQSQSLMSDPILAAYRGY